MRTVKTCILLGIFLLSFSMGTLAESSGFYEGIDISHPFMNFPKTDEEGYLELGSEAGDEFVYTNDEDGVWIYLSNSLRIEVYRCKSNLQTGKTVWYEAEIWSKEPVFRVFSDNPDRPKYGYDYPQMIAREHRVILALNGDYYTFRIGSKIRLGVIIRDGQIISAKTNAGKVVAQPPLDELALYGDGRMEVHHPQEIKAAEYIEQGVLDVMAFGPILIRDGQMDDRIQKKFRALEPRTAIGMIEPGHYIAINAEGRTKRSVGVTCHFLAERMKIRGAVTAFNLDGGQTSGMFFMGTAINEPGEFNKSKFIRKQPDIIGIGFSQKVRNDRNK